MEPNKDKKTSHLQLAFEQNSSVTFLYKKAEKLASAIYLVTGLIKDEEHLKWQLRKKSIELLSDITILSHQAPLDKRHGRKIASHFAEILSLLDIALISKIVSEMNSSILKGELLSLLSILEREIFSEASQTPILSSEFFDVKREGGGSEDALSIGTFSANSAKDMRVPEKGMQKLQQKSYKGHSMSFRNMATDSHGPKGQNSDRGALILELLKTKPEIAVTDVSAVIKGCSEKTIQRELLAMVASGVLKKQGERRWSKYSLAKA